MAKDLPNDIYPQSEEGYNAATSTILGKGLMISFDSWQSGAADHGPGFEVKFEGESVGFVPSPDIRDGVNRVEEGIPSITRDGWIHCRIDLHTDGRHPYE